ncbi:hypothetical protein CAter282_3038 [Collimonas arenae]|uniref:Uncharacterized protein n=1 Tax=Collimonas arenae TaxID=279058 RepID=A0A127QL03_9BURK|nr:hypothetical protein CAter10_3344 [Collimonas arenae]AMP10753.1 hypothetical protein CAter282_3038 [Collimonas arenae]
MAHASGGDEDSYNRFAPDNFVSQPELGRYAAGTLGIVGNGYWRVYLFMAYRALHNQPIGAAAPEALGIAGWGTALLQDRMYSHDGVDAWLQARQPYADAAITTLDPWRAVGPKDSFQSYLNCPKDAFDNATQTLEARKKSDGAQWLKTWVKNQDVVFSQCAGGNATVLAPLPDAAPAWLKADYAYQSAAALFYKQDFITARKLFQAIAADSKSPWQRIAPYLAARSLIRQAELNESAGSPAYISNLQTARNELRTIAGKYAPAQGMLARLEIRLNPEQRLPELGKKLANASFNPPSGQTAQDLSDYLSLLDRFENADSTLWSRFDPMTLWILTMQQRSPAMPASAGKPSAEDIKHAASVAEAYTQAQSRWQKEKSPEWLIAALSSAPLGKAAPDLMKAADSLPADSPAYQSARYYTSRHLQAQKQDAAVWRSSAPEIKGNDKTLASSVNLWRALALPVAPKRSDFIAALWRHPVDQSESYVKSYAIEARKNAAAKPNDAAAAAEADAAQRRWLEVSSDGLDDDGFAALNNALPLSEWMMLAQDANTPKVWKTRLAESIWMRGLVLGDYASVDQVSATIAQDKKTTANLWQRYQQARTPADKENAALIIWANSPELQPEVANWQNFGDWCARPATTPTSLSYLNSDEQQRARRESQQIAKAGGGVNYFGDKLLSYAKKNPADADVPKALYFLIQRTRGACSSNASRVSKAAYQLLKSQHPNEPWAQKAKYWY